jgi:hypothetical protein
MALTDADRIAAEALLQRDLADQPKAVYARCDRSSSRIIVGFDNGLEVDFTPHLAEGLDQATPAQLSVIEISPLGDGLHWPAIDADLHVPGLLAGVFGSKRWMSHAVTSRRASEERAGTAEGPASTSPKRRFPPS